MQRLARKFDAQLNFQSGSVIGELKAPRPTSISIMRELVPDSSDHAAACSTSPRISPSGSSMRTARLSVERGILDTSA
jgi:hypothetical protein